jgi:hypothetical protein
MRPELFRKLLDWLQLHGDLKDTKLLSPAEKLIIFLMLFNILATSAYIAFEC